jgi:hypothetical protein
MDHYAANGLIAAVSGAPGHTALSVDASSLTRGKIYFFTLSVGGTPVADNILEWLVRRFNVAGTGTAVTPVAKDPGAPAAQLGARQGFTVEPAYTTTLFDIAVHQRSLYQWNAAPGGEIIIPATSGNGVGITPIHASYNGSAQAVAHWEE